LQLVSIPAWELTFNNNTMTNLSQVPAKATAKGLTIQALYETNGFKLSAPAVEAYAKAAKQFTGKDISVEDAIKGAGLWEKWDRLNGTKEALNVLAQFQSSLTGPQLALLRTAMTMAGKTHAQLMWELNGATVTTSGSGKLMALKKTDKGS
jgi:pyocin large subunit-like protein